MARSRAARAIRRRWGWHEWSGAAGQAGTPGTPHIPAGALGNTCLKWKHGCSRTPCVLIKACVFQEPVLLVFALLLLHNIGIHIYEQHTFPSVPIAWELLTLKSNIFSIFKLWWKICHGVHLHKFYMNCISLLPIGMGKWWIKQVWISLCLLWGDSEIKANISLCLQMSRILKLCDI